MTKIILVRHGEPDYSYVRERGFKGHGIDLAQLTPKGIEQAKAVAKDSRLDGAQLIIASPYTRALQTAAIISKERLLDISIEVDLHEWMPDLSFNFKSELEVRTAGEELISYKGTYTDADAKGWEKLSSVADRSFNCLKRYLNYDKIIVVCHGIVMMQFQYQHYIKYCDVLEIDFHEDYIWGGWVDKESFEVLKLNNELKEE